jgi:hypothetical protein
MSKNEKKDDYKIFLLSAAGTIAVYAGIYFMKRYIEKADPESFAGKLYKNMFGREEKNERSDKFPDDARYV